MSSLAQLIRSPAIPDLSRSRIPIPRRRRRSEAEPPPGRGVAVSRVRCGERSFVGFLFFECVSQTNWRMQTGPAARTQRWRPHRFPSSRWGSISLEFSRPPGAGPRARRRGRPRPIHAARYGPIARRIGPSISPFVPTVHLHPLSFRWREGRDNGGSVLSPPPPSRATHDTQASALLEVRRCSAPW